MNSHQSERVMFCEAGHHGGSVKRLCNLLDNIDTSRIKTFLITYYSSGKAADLIKSDKLISKKCLGVISDTLPTMFHKCSFLSIPTPFFIKYFYTAMLQLIKNKPTIVYCNNTPYCHFPMICAAKLCGVPIICHMRDTIMLTKIEKLALNMVSKIIVLSQDAFEFYLKQCVAKNKMQIIYNGIDLCSLSYDMNIVNSDISSPKNIVMIGTLIKRKNQIMALEVLKRLIDENYNVRLTFIGDGPDSDKLYSFVNKNGLAHYVNFAGWQDNIFPYLEHSNIGLMLSEREGMPNVILEYMAASLPVVATSLPGIHEMVSDGVTGFVVNNEVNAICFRIKQLLDDPIAAKNMGQKGRDVLENGKFTVISELSDIFSVLNSKLYI